MANNITLMKNGVTDIIYRMVNDSATAATFTIDPANLARADQTISGTPTVGISSIVYCAAGDISITRNGILQYFFSANSGEHSNAYATDRDQSDKPIVVSIAKGTVTIRLLKGPQYKQA